MSWLYTFNPYIYLSGIFAIFMLALAWYSWSRRSTPGALPFVFACLFGVLWILGIILEDAALEFPARVFWIKFQEIWQIPAVTAITCFVLEYAGLDRWLTRRNLILLAAPSVLILVLAITNDFHHLVWVQFLAGIPTQPVYGIAHWAGAFYALILTVINLGVFIWLLVRSPQHRWPVSLMLLGQISARWFYALDTINFNFSGLVGSEFFVLVLPSLTYAIAMFQFHVFDPVPLARAAVIEQMKEGMMVLDPQGRIVDLNSAAVRILGETAASLRKRIANEILPAKSRILTHMDKSGMVFEVGLGNDKSTHYYVMHLTPLFNQRGHELGQLLLFHEITEERRAQTQVIEHQQVLATLQERDRLARELHDSLAQVLGYINLQTQTIQKYMQDGNIEKAGALLARMAETARDAHADVRESILNLKTETDGEWSFIPTLKQYLNDFRSQCNIQTELILPEDLREDKINPRVGIQLLRVIQEAMTNARKHSGAQTVLVAIQQENDQTHVSIGDDGCGFNPAELTRNNGSHFGLNFMQERMAQIGGSVQISSWPGVGTVIELKAPTQPQGEKIP